MCFFRCHTKSRDRDWCGVTICCSLRRFPNPFLVHEEVRHLMLFLKNSLHLYCVYHGIMPYPSIGRCNRFHRHHSRQAAKNAQQQGCDLRGLEVRQNNYLSLWCGGVSRKKWPLPTLSCTHLCVYARLMRSTMNVRACVRAFMHEALGRSCARTDRKEASNHSTHEVFPRGKDVE